MEAGAPAVTEQGGAAAGGRTPIAPFDMGKLAKGTRVNCSIGLGPGLVYLVCAQRWSWLHLRTATPQSTSKDLNSLDRKDMGHTGLRRPS